MTGFLAPSADDLIAFRDTAAAAVAGLLLVVDYAETRRGQLQDLMRALWEAPMAPLGRVLLLARSDGEWWDLLRTDLDDDLGETIPLAPLHQASGDRSIAWATSVTSFADVLNHHPEALPDVNTQTRWRELTPRVEVPVSLAADTFASALALQATALHRLIQTGPAPISDGMSPMRDSSTRCFATNNATGQPAQSVGD